MARVNLHNSNALMAAYHQSKTIPPRKNPPRDNAGFPTHLIPGYGGAQTTQAAVNAAKRHPNDGTPRPRYGAQRAPYNEDERFKRKHPYNNQRGDATRPHRPQLN